MSKIKGTRAERELIHLFWKSGWSAMRAAGSGSIRYPCPDVIAGNAARHIVIEAKSTKEVCQYLTEKEVSELIEFAHIFGAEPWIAVRFDSLEQRWYFLNPEDIARTEAQNYAVTIKLAKGKGLSFEELIK